MDLATSYAAIEARFGVNTRIKTDLPQVLDSLPSATLETASVAVDGLVTLGALDRIPLANAWGACDYRLRRPAPGYVAEFARALVEGQPSVRDMREPLFTLFAHSCDLRMRWRVNAEPLDLAGASALAHRLRAADRQVEMQRAG